MINGLFAYSTFYLDADRNKEIKIVFSNKNELKLNQVAPYNVYATDHFGLMFKSDNPIILFYIFWWDSLMHIYTITETFFLLPLAQ